LLSENSLPTCDVQRHLALWKNIPGHRDHRSGDHDEVITIIQESLITFRRNTDHDHPGIAITIVRESLITIPRNPQVIEPLVAVWIVTL